MWGAFFLPIIRPQSCSYRGRRAGTCHSAVLSLSTCIQAWAPSCSQLAQSALRVSAHTATLALWETVPLCSLLRRHSIHGSLILLCCHILSDLDQVTGDASAWIMYKITAYIRILSVTKYRNPAHSTLSKAGDTIFLKWKTLGMSGSKLCEDSGSLPNLLHSTCEL